MKTIQRSSRSGFSVMELVAAVAILVILAGVLVPAVGTQMSKAREARASTDMNMVAEAFNAYHGDTGTWPSNATFNPNRNVGQELMGFPCLYSNVFDHEGWSGPYLNEGYKVDDATMNIAIAGSGDGGGLRDPWGNNYRVYYVARNDSNGNGALFLYSMGPDARMNTNTRDVRAGLADGDDIVQVVTRSL